MMNAVYTQIQVTNIISSQLKLLVQNAEGTKTSLHLVSESEGQA